MSRLESCRGLLEVVHTPLTLGLMQIVLCIQDMDMCLYNAPRVYVNRVTKEYC